MGDGILPVLLDAIHLREAVALVTVIRAAGRFQPWVGRHSVVWASPDRVPEGSLSWDALPPAQRDSLLGQVHASIRARNHQELALAEADARLELFVEVQRRSPQLLIVGAGHIAVPLATMGKVCDFSVSVLDDRAQYAHPARFPTADRVIAGPFQPELQTLRAAGHLSDDTYVVLITRGHQHDVDCLVELLDDPLAYIGMIGSQRRVRAVFELLERERGIDPVGLDRVYAPVGLDIGAHTPAEIAVCILAEIINVMRQGPAVSLSTRIRTEWQRRRTAKESDS